MAAGVIAIACDRFMLSDLFGSALRSTLDNDVGCRKMDRAWPDEPMQHGYMEAALEGPKAHRGEPASLLDFIGDAQILITHLAGAMLETFAEEPHPGIYPQEV